MNKKSNQKEHPTRKQVNGAIAAQAPLDSQSSPTIVEITQQGAVEAPQKLQLAQRGAFKRLAGQTQSARIILNESLNFAKPENFFREDYKDGLESPPFLIRRAFEFDSKEGYGHRLGLEVLFDNFQAYNVALGLNNENDMKRHAMLDYFKQNTAPIGPVCFKKLDLNNGNPYIDVAPYNPNLKRSEYIDIPFEDVIPEIDDRVPF